MNRSGPFVIGLAAFGKQTGQIGNRLRDGDEQAIPKPIVNFDMASHEIGCT